MKNKKIKVMICFLLIISVFSIVLSNNVFAGYKTQNEFGQKISKAKVEAIYKNKKPMPGYNKSNLENDIKKFEEKNLEMDISEKNAPKYNFKTNENSSNELNNLKKVLDEEFDATMKLEDENDLKVSELLNKIYSEKYDIMSTNKEVYCDIMNKIINILENKNIILSSKETKILKNYLSRRYFLIIDNIELKKSVEENIF